MSSHKRPRRRRSGLLTGRLVLPQWAYASPSRRRVHGVGQQWPPSPLAGSSRRPRSRVRWSWAVVGSVAVALGSVTFIAASGGSPPSSLQKKSLDAPGATGVSTSTSPNSPTTTIRHNGQVTSSSSGNGVAHGVPLGVYAGEGDPAGIAPSPRRPGRTRPTPRVSRRGEAAGPPWTAPPTSRRGAPLPVSPGDRRAYPARGGLLRPGGHRCLQPVLHHPGRRTW